MLFIVKINDCQLHQSLLFNKYFSEAHLLKHHSDNDACWSGYRCIYVEKKNQLDATEWFIALIICSTCFGHFYAHHQELETICVLLPPMVCSALFAGCQKSGAEQQAMRPE